MKRDTYEGCDKWNTIARRKLGLDSSWEWRAGQWQDNGDLLLKMRQMPDGVDRLPVTITKAELEGVE